MTNNRRESIPFVLHGLDFKIRTAHFSPGLQSAVCTLTDRCRWSEETQLSVWNWNLGGGMLSSEERQIRFPENNDANQGDWKWFRFVHHRYQAVIIFPGTRGDGGRLQRQENKSSPAEKADFRGRTIQIPYKSLRNPNAITMTERTELNAVGFISTQSHGKALPNVRKNRWFIIITTIVVIIIISITTLLLIINNNYCYCHFYLVSWGVQNLGPERGSRRGVQVLSKPPETTGNRSDNHRHPPSTLLTRGKQGSLWVQ